MRNLISNGLKFTPKDGKVDVLVDIVNGIVDVNKQISHNDMMLRVRVVDTGAGISPVI